MTRRPPHAARCAPPPTWSRPGCSPPGRRPAIEAVAARYAIAVTPPVAALIDAADRPTRSPCNTSPTRRELVTAPHEIDDPTADAPFTPVPGIVHRYPDRALLKPLLACPVYCRFCFRREVVGPDGGLLTEAELEAALAWLAATPAVREVILTGGDPLMLSAAAPRPGWSARLSAIPHVEIIRIHSRVPVADPGRVTPALAAALETDSAALSSASTPTMRASSRPRPPRALRRLAPVATLLGQSVLLRGVNDSEAALEDLFRAMLRHRVKPYYLHQLDPAPGTARFHVPNAEAGAAAGAARALSGLAWPTYVRETPGGGGKVPSGRFLSPAPCAAAGR